MIDPIFILAGMPAILPFEVPLDDAGSEPVSRQIMSLVVAAIAVFVLAKVIQSVWNSLAVDFPKLPKLGYLKSLGFTVLWGLAMFLVLAMIAGTREALTPEAWVQNGWTYRLADENGEEIRAYREERKTRLQKIYRQLQDFADAHDGEFPQSLDELASDAVNVPGVNGLAYVYFPAANAPNLLVEPEIDSVQYAITREGKLVER